MRVVRTFRFLQLPRLCIRRRPVAPVSDCTLSERSFAIPLASVKRGYASTGSSAVRSASHSYEVCGSRECRAALRAETAYMRCQFGYQRIDLRSRLMPIRSASCDRHCQERGVWSADTYAASIPPGQFRGIRGRGAALKRRILPVVVRHGRRVSYQHRSAPFEALLLRSMAASGNLAHAGGRFVSGVALPMPHK